jgi:uncharacterized protein
MSEFKVTDRTKVKRGNQRATYDTDTVYKIIDDALVCHVGAKMADRPMVQPTIIWRINDKVYIHGSSKNGLFAALVKGEEACITVTHLDGLVMARSSFHHSVNYRSVMIFSKATEITDESQKLYVLNEMMKQITPDRFDGVREPNQQELKATSVLQFDLTEVSAKVRTGPPVDDDEDLALPVWAGVIPVTTVMGNPIDDPLWLSNHGKK